MSDDVTTDTDAKPDESPELVERLVGEVRDSLQAMRDGSTAPAVTTTGPGDTAAKAKAAQDKLDAALNAVDAKAAEGEYGKGLRDVLTAITEAQALTTVDQSQNPAMIALEEQAFDTAERRNKTMFDSYADEINAEIRALPQTDRIRSTGIQKAIDAVKLRHLDEIKKADVDAAVAEEVERIRAAALAPSNAPTPRLGEASDTELHGLDVTERELAVNMGVTYEQYAVQKKAETERVNRDGTVDIMARLKPGPNPIARGRF